MIDDVVVPKPRWTELAREYQLRRDAAILRGPVEWSWDITNKCVLCCLHCFNRSGILKRAELSNDEMRDVAGQLAALKPLGICFCGGEPTLRLPILLELARVFREVGTTANMVTNGQLMTAAMARDLREAGIQMVQVSLDGSTAESHDRLRGIPGAFDNALDAIRMLRDADSVVGVSFTPTSFNIEEFWTVYDLCLSLGVSELRIQPLMPLGEAQLRYEELTPSPEQYRRFVEEYKVKVLDISARMRLEWGDPVDHLIRFGQFYTMPPYSMHITSDGFLAPSVYLPVFLGSVRRHRIQEYWRGGLSSAWQLRILRELALRVRSNRDFMYLRPHPYFDKWIDLDLIDRTPEEIDRITDVVLDMNERIVGTGARPAGPWTWRPRTAALKELLRELYGTSPSVASAGRL
jgi:MoaA/NifB/PqqE/SkfB family radical SAM enzyme